MIIDVKGWSYCLEGFTFLNYNIYKYKVKYRKNIITFGEANRSYHLYQKDTVRSRGSQKMLYP